MVRRNGSVCAVKVSRQVAFQWTADARAVRGGVSYGGWRYWCLVCNAYDWAGSDIGSSMDRARAHLAAEHPPISTDWPYSSAENRGLVPVPAGNNDVSQR